MNTATVRSALDLTIVGAELPLLLTCQFEYRASDPYAVTVLFDTGSEHPVEWVFSRDLLDEGLVLPSGDGDVQVVPVRDDSGALVLQLLLSSPDGVAVLEASADAVLEFLGRSYALVPPGTESEHVDMDATLARLLA